jgi:hypothetical protein
MAHPETRAGGWSERQLIFFHALVEARAAFVDGHDEAREFVR